MNALKIEGVSSPVGRPGSGRDIQFKKTYNTKSTEEVLGIEWRSKEDMVRDIIGNLREVEFAFSP